jgi:drug/metabolite transporter (DMT)-like permease
MSSRRRRFGLALDALTAVVLLTFAATQSRHAPTAAAFLAVIGLMSLTVFVVRLRQLERPRPRVGLALISLFVVLGFIVLGDTAATADDAFSMAWGYIAAAALLALPVWAARSWRGRR